MGSGMISESVPVTGRNVPSSLGAFPLASGGDSTRLGVEVDGADILSGELWRRYSAARDARRSGGVENEMVADLRRRDGEYEPEVVVQLGAQGGSKAFDNVTDVKCSGAESMLIDLFCYSGQRPWGLEPTPEPELDERLMEEALRASVEWAASQGYDPAAAGNEGAMLEMAMGMKERMKGEMVRVAKRAAGRMEERIADQLKEGGFEDALNEFVVDFVTHKVAALMGPMPMKRLVYVGGRWEERLVLAVERVNPTDIYPAANSLKPEDGDFFVRKVVGDDFAHELAGVPGVSAEQLGRALAKGGAEKESIDTELERYANRGGNVDGNKPDREHVLLYWWHRMSRQEIAAWKGEEAAVDENEPERKEAYFGLMLNGVVIKALPNLDKSGKPNVFVASYRKRPGSFWGWGLAGLCRETQEAVNVVKRATMNNIHMSSMVSYQADKAALVQPDSMAKQFPGQVILTRQMPGDNRDPVKPLVTPNFTNVLLEARRDLVTALDEKTGVYPQSYGNPNQVGPAETMGGYQMLRQDQTKTLKRALKNMSDAIAGLIRAYWQWNMIFSEDESIKGDVQIVTRGAVQLYLTSDEADRTMAAIAMLERSPVAPQYVKPDGWAWLYKSAFRMQRLDPDMVFVSDAELAEKIAADQQARLAEMEAQANGEAPQGEQAPPEPESVRMKAQADMMKAQAAQEKVRLDARRVAIQQAEATGRLRQMQEQIRQSRMQKLKQESQPALGAEA